MASKARTALEHADEVVDRLLESGRAPGDVLVLTTGGAHPWQQHEASFGEEHYWAQLDEGGDVFYADALTARPVVREVVVLAINGNEEHTAQALAEALGRARSLLVVCGESRRLRVLVNSARRPVGA